MQFSSLVVAFALAALAAGASPFSPARPPAVPLTVRSPYLNTWQFAGKDDGNGGLLHGRWQQHWSGNVNAMAGIIRVDGKAYEFMGFPSQRTSGLTQVDQKSLTYTSTRSVFVSNAGPVQIKTTFLSPISPDDQQRASLVSSYVNVEVSSTDNNQHDVQLYTDISAEWATGDPKAVLQWSYNNTDEVVYHKLHRQTQLLFSESPKSGGNLDKAEWGNWYWAGPKADASTYQSGGDVDVRGQFASNGKLTNAQDTKYRTAADNYPVMGLAYDLGKVGSGAVSRLFTMGLFQTEAIQFAGKTGTVSLPSLWTSYFKDELDALSWFHKDFSTASTAADALDSRFSNDAKKAGGDALSTITTLSARQAFGGVQLAGNSSKPYLFLKEISSDGNIQTVDVIYPAIPIFLYANHTYAKLLLDPLFENQESGQYPNPWAMHDLGGSYPNATGHKDGKDEKMPLEESSNMLVMTYAYYKKSQDVAYLKQHYDILKRWTGYLVQFALNQESQLTTDDFAGPLTNSTNLAYKGVIGIGAMAQIANLTGHADDAKNFSSIATSYISQLNTLAFDDATNPTKALLEFGKKDSWLTLYNLYADKLLGLNLVPQKVYDVQNKYYPSQMQKYGLPLDSRTGGRGCKNDWMMFAAAAANADVQKTLIEKLAQWINDTPSSKPMTDLNDVQAPGDYAPQGQFYARPVVGGHFALLALNN